MNRFNITRSLILLASLALGGCFSQGAGPDDGAQTDNEPRHAELVGVDGADAPIVAHTAQGIVLVGNTPKGGQQSGPQPEPWWGSDGDSDGPQPEPWKASRIGPDPGDPSSAAASKP